MIEAENLGKAYGAVRALDGVSFSAKPGEILGYLGPNGAGKSTTVKILTGLIHPTEGGATIGGHSIREDPVEAKRLIGLVPESGALYEALTPLEYLRFVGALYELEPKDCDERARGQLAELQLDEKAWNQRLSGLSKGMKQRVVIAAALLHRPRVLLFDEPLNGLDVGGTVKVKEIIAREAARGCTILYCSHLLDVVERVCSRIIILSEGKIQVDGSLSSILARYPGKTLEEVFQELTRGGAMDVDGVDSAEGQI